MGSTKDETTQLLLGHSYQQLNPEEHLNYCAYILVLRGEKEDTRTVPTKIKHPMHWLQKKLDGILTPDVNYWAVVSAANVKE